MLLNYQKHWLSDESQIKIWEKSRQIGASFVQAYEDVRDCATGRVRDVWYSSADESAATAYIKYCRHWIELFQSPLTMINSALVNVDDDITTLRVSFLNGATIHALSSNPKNFRSKRGKVVLDEFAFHGDAAELWNAAKPVTTWGYDLRIISSHFTTDSLFFQFVKSIRSGELGWSLHRTTIEDAVSDGLVDKILERDATNDERLEWVSAIRRECFNEATFNREYMCTPDSESNRLFTPDEITAAVSDVPPSLQPLWLGVDLGRYHDPTEIVFLGYDGTRYFVTDIQTFHDKPLIETEQHIAQLIKIHNLRGVAIDNTGIGQGTAENLQKKFPHIVIPYTFSASSKESLALRFRDYITQKLLCLPPSRALLDQCRDVIISPRVNSTFSIHADRAAGHNSDKFWAACLALHAAVHRPAQVGGFVAATRKTDVLKSNKSTTFKQSHKRNVTH